jgi:uncharacterized protein (TIGR02300 family)
LIAQVNAPMATGAPAGDLASQARRSVPLQLQPKERIVAKPELGTKRFCTNCGAKFYDLNKDPIVCPKCQTAMAAPTYARARPEAVSPATVPEEEAVVPETADAEFVSLEDAEAEASGKKPGEEATEGADEEVELEDEGMDDAPFIEEQEDEDEDVTDIIGDVEDEEES